MVVLTARPTVLKDVLLEIGTDDFRAFAESVTFTPSASTITWTGLGGNTHTDASVATWTLDLTYSQDWDSTNSLSRFLYENEGETVSVTFAPKSGSGPSFIGDVVITPGAIGGAVGVFLTTSVTLGMSGRPELVPAA